MLEMNLLGYAGASPPGLFGSERLGDGGYEVGGILSNRPTVRGRR
jgi:hypothetical protein